MAQAAEALEKERQLKEAEKLYMNLRQVLSRQPGPDVQTSLIKTQRALTLRGNKMKVCLMMPFSKKWGRCIRLILGYS